jgi:glucose/arabinose dehydrogenase
MHLQQLNQKYFHKLILMISCMDGSTLNSTKDVFVSFINDMYLNAIDVPQGTPCNRCKMDLPYSSLTSIKKDGSDYTVHARGIRNTVGFDFHPTTGNMWFTDNGGTKDEEFGDNHPGDELNELVPKQTMPHFGYPFCYEKSLVDKDFNNGTDCDAYIPAKYTLDAHVAALGMKFYNAGTKNNEIPAEYRGDNLVLIAEHGSINRTTNVGYRITSVNTTNPTAEAYKIFIEGWMDTTTGKAWGRPVDVLVLSDGSFLISDDRAGVIYRVFYPSTASIKLWAYIAFPLLFFFALSAVGAGVYFFNKYQRAKQNAPTGEEEFQPMEEEDS